MRAALSPRAWVAWLCIALLLPAPVSAAESRPLVVATYAYPQRDRIAAITPLADYLARRSGRKVDVKLLPSPTALVDALHAGEVDVVVPNLHGYLQAQRRRERAITLPVPDVPPAQAERYRAVLLARAGLDSLAAVEREAASLRLMLVGADSASGGFIPAQHLLQAGLDPRTSFASLDYAGSHAAALEALVDGRADIVALAAEVHDAARPGHVHELWRSPPIPPGPLVCRVAAEVPCGHIEAWLLEAHDHDPQVMAALRVGWPEFGDAVAFTDPWAVRSALPGLD